MAKDWVGDARLLEPLTAAFPVPAWLLDAGSFI